MENLQGSELTSHNLASLRQVFNSGRILRARLEAGNCHPGTLFRTDIDVHLLGLREAQEKRGSSMNWTQNDQIKEIQKFAGTLT